jgi:PAS domain-containing protein
MRACNENYAKDLNIPQADIPGKTDYDFYPAELADKYINDDKQIMASGGTAELEEAYSIGGADYIINTVKTAVKDENGDIVGLLGIFWDITEKKESEKTAP